MALRLGEFKIGTTGDLIVGGGAYALGFIVDAFFFPGGATSAEVAGASAIGALAAKHAVQLIVQRWRRGQRGNNSPGSDS